MRVDLVALLLPLVLSSLNDHSQRILERIREGSTIIRIVPPVYLLTIGGGPLGVVPPLSLRVAPGRRDPPDTTAPMVGVPGAVEGVTVIEAVDAMVVEEKPHAVVPIDGLPESIGVENVPTPAQSPVPAIGDEIHPQISQNRLHARHPSPLLPLTLVLQARISRLINPQLNGKHRPRPAADLYPPSLHLHLKVTGAKKMLKNCGTIGMVCRTSANYPKRNQCKSVASK